MKKKLILILLCIPVCYFITKVYVCYNIDHLAFVPSKMDQDEDFQFDFEFTERYLKINEKDSISMIHSKTSKQSKGVVLFLHGNSADLRSWGKMMPQFHNNGYDVAMVDYPGFGKSTGKHTEQGLYDSADKMYAWAKKNYNPDDIVVIGRSIGTVPASYISSKKKLKLVVLETPLSNMGLVMEHKFKYAPICKALYEKFCVDKWMEDSKNDIHLIRSEFDELIKPESNVSLLPMAKSNFTVLGAKHGNLGGFESYQKRLSELLLN